MKNRHDPYETTEDALSDPFAPTKEERAADWLNAAVSFVLNPIILLILILAALLALARK